MQTRFLLTILFITTFSVVYSQDYNPFKSIGKKGKIVTAYEGRFIEIFDYDSIQRIGSIMFNIRTEKIVRLLNADTTFKKSSDNSSVSRWYSVDKMAEKYYSQSPYTFALNNPVLFNDPDGRDVDPTNLKGKDNLNALKNVLSTKEGLKQIAQFMHKGQRIDITIGGKTTSFSFNKEGARANDKLTLISSPNSQLNPEGNGNAGMPRTGVTTETEKNSNKEIGDDKNYDVSKGVNFNVYLRQESSETESTSTLAHEMTVHVDPNEQRLQQIENKMVDGTLKPGTGAYLKQLQNIQGSAGTDHTNMGKGLNTNYQNMSAQLDQLKNTNQYTELYQKDVAKYKTK